MSSDLSTITSGQDFKAVIKDKVLGALMDLIPEEKLMELVNGEIKAFFECESVVVVQQGKIQIANPRYDETKYQGYGNEKTLSKDCMTLSMQMTPFRQLVWTTLYEHLSGKVTEAITSESSDLSKEISSWFEDQAKPDLIGTQRSLINKYTMAAGTGMMANIIETANSRSKASIISALQQTGADISRVSI